MRNAAASCATRQQRALSPAACQRSKEAHLFVIREPGAGLVKLAVAVEGGALRVLLLGHCLWSDWKVVSDANSVLQFLSLLKPA